ncbi:hypothetical protein PR003_g3812 [Phytophthora rubi]|uniref:Uncharacterized protein n=1 Tax=Phytophthora rubi TaxID=129364 RepID=A0A6A4FWP3_9STRA|nr:hypothetical protein PR001_g21252 [Phytophthora rubi]KAE9353533.1 hypothetical protein PR003_g3812 [Phytophthora rubi]
MNASVLKEFPERFAWWMYITRMPFCKTEHHALVETLQVLSPGISVPSAYQLTNPSLDVAYNKSIVGLTVKLVGRVVTLETDGRTDINGMTDVIYMAVSGDLSYFLESVYTGAQIHDTLSVVADVKRVLLKYKNIEFGSVVTDNTSANKAVWENLQSEFPKVFFQGCRELVAFFKRSHKLWFVLRRKLKEKKLRALVVLGDTRLGSLWPVWIAF